MIRGTCILRELDIKRKKIRVTFLAYRDWALDSINKVVSIGNIEVKDIIRSEEEYKGKVLAYQDGFVDCIVLIGWSWIIKDETLKKFLCVGMHPSDLPMYRGGCPIQHQIIDGLEKTQISLMTISSDGVDVGDIWLKEEWNLSGHTMKEILDELSVSTARLLNTFFFRFTEIKPLKQKLSKGSYCKRRKPSDSRITWDVLSEMTLKEVYNLIRALGDPYPNIFIEDDEGNRLFFKEVEYQNSAERIKEMDKTMYLHIVGGVILNYNMVMPGSFEGEREKI